MDVQDHTTNRDIPLIFSDIYYHRIENQINQKVQCLDKNDKFTKKKSIYKYTIHRTFYLSKE